MTEQQDEPREARTVKDQRVRKQTPCCGLFGVKLKEEPGEACPDQDWAVPFPWRRERI